MKTCLSASVFALSISLCAAQSSQYDEKGLTQKSAAYHHYRLYENKPPCELKKITALISKIKLKSDGAGDESETSALDPKVFMRLSNGAKFTYCMIHGEISGQNCDGMPAVLNEENKIFAFPPGPFGEEADWSDIQRAFLHSHRGTVISLIRETVHQQGRVGVNLKKAIIELGAIELIPDLVQMYRHSSKDRDLLTVMSVLMKNLNFRRYTRSDQYFKLYSGETNYKSSIPLTVEASKRIQSDAMALYRLHRS